MFDTAFATKLSLTALVLVVGSALGGCASGDGSTADDSEAETTGSDGQADEGSADVETTSAQGEALSAISCGQSAEEGYVNGRPSPIEAVTVDGKPVETQTADAYFVMAQGAARDGIELSIVSGFRTMAQQEYLYGCYLHKNCNDGNLAAAPGYSNHQSGHALDLNTSDRGVYAWLEEHAASYGFKRTVPSEIWHWEWWGGGPGGGPCSGASAPKAPTGGASCESDTLHEEVASNACVQSKYDRKWYQCDAGRWVDRYSDPSACSSVHPL